MTLFHHALKILSIIVPVFLIGYLISLFYNVSPLFGEYFQISTELLALVLSFSIFLTSWVANPGMVDRHSVFLGAVFYITGILYMYHLLSYPFMPDFITTNTLQKSTLLRGGTQAITALLLFTSVFIHNDTNPKLVNKPLLFTFAILSIISFAVGFFYFDDMPEKFLPDGNPSSAMTILILFTIATITVTAYLYSKRFKKTGQKSIIYLLYGLIILILSTPVFIFSDISDNLLKSTGFYFIYLAIYQSAIKNPYEKLARDEGKLRQFAEEKYRNLFDYANDGIIIHDLGERVIAWNKSAEDILGWKSDEVIGKKVSQLIVPSRLQEERNQIVRNALLGNAVTGIDTVRLRKDGTKIDVSVSISPLLNSKQNVTGFSSIIRDITERKRAEDHIKKSLEEKEVLLKEIHHRVKNNMQVISSMLKLQSGYIEDEKYLQIFKESQQRIITMSLIHEKLYQSKDMAGIDFKEYTKDLANGIFQSYGINMNRIKLIINVKDIYLSVDDAIPCGLIINELISNSLKHAFPDNRNGEIKVDIQSSNENDINLSVSDNGAGIPDNLDFRKTRSLGLHLVTILAENQLQGEIDLNKNEGTEFKIKFKRGK